MNQGGNVVTRKPRRVSSINRSEEEQLVGEAAPAAGVSNHEPQPHEEGDGDDDALYDAFATPSGEISEVPVPEPELVKRTVGIANARDGLNLRSGPSPDFPVIRSIPFGARLHVIKREGRWGLVDELGDGAADGFVHLAFLNEATPASIPASALLTIDQVRAFWGSRNPRGGRLYDRDGNPLVDPQLLHASAAGSASFEGLEPRYRVEIYGPASGLRDSGSTRNHTRQPGTGRGAAIDYVIIDLDTGKMLTNHPARQHQHQGTAGGNAPIYQRYYNEVVRAGSQLYSGFAEKARFGGYFATGDNALDTMHIDMRGKEVPLGGGSLRGGFTHAQMERWHIPENYPYR